MDQTDNIETHCPLCGRPVTKVKEMSEEDCKLHSECENEVYRHKGNKLIKITNPTTPTDIDRANLGL